MYNKGNTHCEYERGCFVSKKVEREGDSRENYIKTEKKERK